LKLQTEIDIPPFEHKIEHKHRIITIGSCFADNMSWHFKKNKFHVTGNPFGVLYNPESIYNVLNCMSESRIFSQNDLVQYMDEWHSFYFNSNFSHNDPGVCIKGINSCLSATMEFIKKADWIILTYGTAFVYKYRDTDMTVSNCHRMPANEFEKLLLDVSHVKKNISDTIELLLGINPGLRFIFTISPVRHWRDGAVNNQISKSTLMLALHSLLGNYKNTFYFPSFEIVMDELRDYRFYGEDLLHPNKTAITCIWEKFRESVLSQSCRNAITDMERLFAAMSHRPRNLQSPAHHKFLKNQLEVIEEYKSKYSYLDFSEEKDFFKKQEGK